MRDSAMRRAQVGPDAGAGDFSGDQGGGGDFGNDQALLRAKIIETVRNEVGHALGLDEAGVRKLGL